MSMTGVCIIPYTMTSRGSSPRSSIIIIGSLNSRWYSSYCSLNFSLAEHNRQISFARINLIRIRLEYPFSRSVKNPMSCAMAFASVVLPLPYRPQSISPGVPCELISHLAAERIWVRVSSSSLNLPPRYSTSAFIAAQIAFAASASGISRLKRSLKTLSRFST